MSDNLTQLLQLILYLGGGAGIAALALGWYTRRELRKKLEAEAEEKKSNAEKVKEEAEKLKADAVQIIEKAAGNMVQQYLADNERLRTECVGLRKEVRDFDVRVGNAENCQTNLTFQVETLQKEKKILTDEVAKLTLRIVDLETENKRLKQESENAKQIIQE